MYIHFLFPTAICGGHAGSVLNSLVNFPVSQDGITIILIIVIKPILYYILYYI